MRQKFVHKTRPLKREFRISEEWLKSFEERKNHTQKNRFVILYLRLRINSKTILRTIEINKNNININININVDNINFYVTNKYVKSVSYSLTVDLLSARCVFEVIGMNFNDFQSKKEDSLITSKLHYLPEYHEHIMLLTG